MGEKDDYDGENSWISDGLPSSCITHWQDHELSRVRVVTPPVSPLSLWRSTGRSQEWSSVWGPSAFLYGTWYPCSCCYGRGLRSPISACLTLAFFGVSYFFQKTRCIACCSSAGATAMMLPAASIYYPHLISPAACPFLYSSISAPQSRMYKHTQKRMQTWYFHLHTKTKHLRMHTFTYAYMHTRLL